jgi:hypothetical protein
MHGAAILDSPIVIDDEALLALARAGHRWLEGHAGRARYRWLLPPDFVLGTQLPDPPVVGLQPVCGGGDRAGRLTAVMGLVLDRDVPPEALAGRGAGAGGRVNRFNSRNGAVAERVEAAGGRVSVITVHAFTAGGQAHRFLINAQGPDEGPESRRALRIVGLALALADEMEGELDRLRTGGRLHG